MKRTQTPKPILDNEKSLEITNAVKEKDETKLEHLLDDVIQCDHVIDTNTRDGSVSLCNLLIVNIPEREDLFIKLIKCCGRKSISQVDSAGYTPLAKAIELGNEKYIRVLLSKRADPNIPATMSSHTALEQAALIGDPSIVKLLLDHGADVNHVNHLGNQRYQKIGTNPRILFLALQSTNTQDTIAKTFVALCEKKAKLYVKDSDGDSILHEAVYKGNLSVTRYLTKKMNVNIAGDYLLTPLSYVADTCKCYHPDWDALDSTIFDTTEEYGLGTKLYKQHPCTHTEIAYLLLQKGAYVNCNKTQLATPSSRNTKPYNILEERFPETYREDVAEKISYRIKNNEWKYNPLCAAVRNSALPIIQMLIDQGSELVLKIERQDLVLPSATHVARLVPYSVLEAVDSHYHIACRAIVKYLFMVALGKYSTVKEVRTATTRLALKFHLESAQNLPRDKKSILDKLLECKWFRENGKRMISTLQSCILKNNLLDFVKLLKCGVSPNLDIQYGGYVNNPLILLCRGTSGNIDTKDKVWMIQALLYYGSTTNNALYSFLRTVRSESEVVVNTAKMFAYCGLDINCHKWLANKSEPLGDIELLNWLFECVAGAAPLLFLCRRRVRDLCVPNHNLSIKVNQLPLPVSLQRKILLEDLMDSELLDFIRSV